MDADRTRLLRRRRVNGSHQVEIERAADRQALREDCGAWKHRAMRPFFVLKKRNLQTRLSQRDFLQLVEVLRLLAGAFMQNLVRQGEETAAGANLLRVCPRREF